MKNNDNDALLAHKRAVDAERKAQAQLREAHKRSINAAIVTRVANAPKGKAS